MSKSLFKSRTFWFNIVTAGLELAQVLPLPPGTVTICVNVGNIVLRLLSDTPVHVVSGREG